MELNFEIGQSRVMGVRLICRYNSLVDDENRSQLHLELCEVLGSPYA
jgi:hypothetical protein